MNFNLILRQKTTITYVLLTCAITLMTLFSSKTASAYEIVSVQSISITPYNDAVRGFEDSCKCSVKQLIMSEIGYDNVLENIHRTKPDLILAIGVKALKSLQNTTDIPVLSIMVLNPGSIVQDNKSITSIDLFLTPGKQLSVIKTTYPDAGTLGIIYDPSKTAYYMEDIMKASVSNDIKIIAKEIQRTKEFPSLLESMKHEIDVLWMIPDMTVITPETVEYAFAFSIENNIPIFTFARKYLEMGALVSFDIDIPDLGKQAYNIAARILSEADKIKIDNIYTRNFNVTINKKIARNYGIIPLRDKLIKAIAIKEKRRHEHH